MTKVKGNITINIKNLIEKVEIKGTPNELSQEQITEKILTAFNKVLASTCFVIASENDVTHFDTETDKLLVAFGNYLLSDERKNNLDNEQNENCVTDADLANFKEMQPHIHQ